MRLRSKSIFLFVGFVIVCAIIKFGGGICCLRGINHAGMSPMYFVTRNIFILDAPIGKKMMCPCIKPTKLFFCQEALIENISMNSPFPWEFDRSALEANVPIWGNNRKSSSFHIASLGLKDKGRSSSTIGGYIFNRRMSVFDKITNIDGHTDPRPVGIEGVSISCFSGSSQPRCLFDTCFHVVSQIFGSISLIFHVIGHVLSPCGLSSCCTSQILSPGCLIPSRSSKVMGVIPAFSHLPPLSTYK